MKRTFAIGMSLVAIAIALALLVVDRPDVRPRAADTAAFDAAAAATGVDHATRVLFTPARRPAARRIDGTNAIDAAVRRHMQALAQSGDARQRLIALRLLATDDPELRRRARGIAASLRADAPGDELIAIAQTWFCAAPDCTPAERAAWREAAPDNAAAYAQGAMAAQTDDGAIDALLADAARATRYDSQYRVLALETIAAFDAIALPPPTPAERESLRSQGRTPTDANRRELLLWAHIAALPLPPLRAYIRACTPPVSTVRARDCQAIFRRMATGTTMIERDVALSMLERLTRGSAGHAYWADAQRDLRWQLHRFASVHADRLYVTDFMRHGEVVALQRALQRAGIPLRAPPGWAPR